MSKFLSQIAARINVCEFLDYKVFLRTVYKEAKQLKSSYTYVLFTEELGLGSSNLLNLVVNGQRRLSQKNAQIIVASLGLVLERRRYFLKLVELELRRNLKKREEAIEKIIEIRSESIPEQHTRRQLEFYSHWLHSVVFEMIAIENTHHDSVTLAHRLIPHAGADEVQASLKLLTELELITFDDKSGRYKKNQSHFIMDDKIQNVGPLAFHNKMIELARDALVRVHEDERDISSMTLAVPRSSIPRLKSLVEKFQNDILKIAEDFAEHEEVYQINIQLFPLTLIKKRK